LLRDYSLKLYAMSQFSLYHDVHGVIISNNGLYSVRMNNEAHETPQSTHNTMSINYHLNLFR